MKKRKLNYRFHDPNPAAAAADYILKIFMEASQEKARLAIQSAADAMSSTIENEGEGHPA